MAKKINKRQVQVKYKEKDRYGRVLGEVIFIEPLMTFIEQSINKTISFIDKKLNQYLSQENLER